MTPMVVIDSVRPGAENGVPGKGVRPPVAGFSPYPEMVSGGFPFPAYTNWLDRSTVTESGFGPAANGDPAIGINPPESGSRKKAEISLDVSLATYTNCPMGSTVTDKGTVPAG